MSRTPGVAVAFATLVALAACRSESPSAVQYVESDPRSSQLTLWVSGCNADAPVSIEESPTAVRLTVTAPSREEGCSDAVLVTLEAPLGDRRVIDAATDDEIASVVSVDE